MTLKIYLAGKIPKGEKAKENYENWRDRYREGLSEIEDLEFLDPDHSHKDYYDSKALMGQDLYQVKTAQITLVNAEHKIGAGTAQEMVVAKYFSNAVITVLPKDTHHRKEKINMYGKEYSDLIHPFMKEFSDLIVEKVEDAIEWIKEFQEDPSSKQIKDLSVIDESIQYHLDNNN